MRKRDALKLKVGDHVVSTYPWHYEMKATILGISRNEGFPQPGSRLLFKLELENGEVTDLNMSYLWLKHQGV